MAMTERGMTLDVAVTTSQALCPPCPQPSTHMQSDYRHTLADLPWAPPPVPFWGRFFENGHDTHVVTLTPVPVAPAA